MLSVRDAVLAALPSAGPDFTRSSSAAQDQMIHFFETGEVVDVCGGVSCFHDGAP